MRRYLFTILSALSLLLCVAMVALWMRSYLASDEVSYHRMADKEKPAYSVIGMDSSSGAVTLSYAGPLTQRVASIPLGFDYRHVPYRVQVLFNRPPDEDTAANRLGFGYRQSAVTSVVMLPHWMFVLLSAILPARWLWLYRQHRLAGRKGLCRKCGYDLRASNERCPECGTAIPAPLVG